MSSWVGDWEKALIPRVNGVKAKMRTNCKIGRELILDGVPMVWLRTPMGLSCLDCARPVAPEVVAREEARLKRAAAPAPKEKEVRHGTSYAYNRLKCRCDDCRAANTEANARWRARRPKKVAA